MDYFSILNLNKEPFSNSPDPEFFFHSRQHLDCLQKLELSLLLRRGLNVVIGDVGTGKTTLCRQLIRRFAQKEEMKTYLILDPLFLYPSEFLTTVVKLLTGKKPAAKTQDWQVKEYIKQYLFRKGVDQGETTVLIIDEGQKIPVFCLEILREFLNYETNEYKLLQIVIFAQSEFEKTVQKYPNFADRISLYHRLKPLSFADTRRMIKFRLEKSSRSNKRLNLFTYPALWAIFRVTGGYPRKIINLCHQSILAMIIQNRSRSNYFLVKKCARRVFMGGSRRWKILIAAAVMGGATAIVLFFFLPLDRLNIGQSHEIFDFKTEDSLNSNLVVIPPLPEADTLGFDDRTVPGDLSLPNRVGPPVIATAPERFEEPAGTEKIEGVVLAGTAVDRSVSDAREESISEPTHSTILGRITLKRKETLAQVMRQVYGGFTSNYLKAIIAANPDIDDPDQLTVGQIISLPAIPVNITPGDTPVWRLKVNETATLEAAYDILRNHPDSFPRVQMIPYWNPAGGSKFSIVLINLFKDEKSARAEQKQLPAELASGSVLFSHWDEKTVFFANPYSGQVP
jgi:general secretion pathway protein A